MIEFKNSGLYAIDELPTDQMIYLAISNSGWTQSSNKWTIEMVPREGFVLRHQHEQVSDSLWLYNSLSELRNQIEMIFKSYSYE